MGLWGILGLALLLTAGLGWVVFTDLWPWVRGTGPWPPEWRWLHVPIDPDARLVGHGALLLAYLAFAAWVTGTGHPRRLRIAVLGGAIFLLLWQLAQSWIREPNVLDTLIFRTYAPPLNGYFLAPAQVESIGHTLNNYLAAMPTFFGDKPQTHPPGLFLFYAASQVIFTGLGDFSSWFANIARTWAAPGQDWPQLSDPLIASAFFTAWVQVGLTSLLPVSVLLFVRQMRFPTQERRDEIALWSSLMAPLIPPLSLFLLQWDTVFPALGMLAWFFALRGQNRLSDLNASGWGQWTDWLWAGLLLSALTWMSFGTMVFGLLIGLHILWREGMAFVENRNRFDPLLALPTVGGLGIMGAGVALPWLLALGVWGMNFFALLQFGLQRHYEIVTALRAYGLWWWMNLVDFALWLGPGSLLLGGVGSVALWLQARQTPNGRAWRDMAGLAVVYWAALLLLNFSGATRGEIGRLWTFLMPFPLILSQALPWSRWQRFALLALLAAWGWIIAYSIPPFLCC